MAVSVCNTIEAEVQASGLAGRVAFQMVYVLEVVTQPLAGAVTVFGNNWATLNMLIERR